MTITHSPRRTPVSHALYALRVLLVGIVVAAGSLAALVAVVFAAVHPFAAVLLGFPLAFGAAFGALFAVGRLGEAVAWRT